VKNKKAMRNKICFIVLIILIPIFIHAGDYDNIHNLIKTDLDALAIDKDTKIGGERIHSIEYISNLYIKNDYQPFWADDASVDDAIKGIISSVEDGLLPQDYHLEAILFLRNELQHDKGSKKENAAMRAELDILLTDGVIFYADHLLYGKLDPEAIVPTWNFDFAPIPDLNPVTFAEYIDQHEISARLNDLRPSLPMYDSLMNILAKYREIAVKGGWENILAGGKIEPGDKDARIPAIRKRLLITGELSQPDSIGSGNYDKIFENDIKAFQAGHALDADGVIGAGTFRELNVPVDKRIESIRINLERIRWVAGNMPDSYIIVNIAGFTLTMVKDKQVVHYTNVVVGKPLNKTPIFRDKMRYIEFNPTWTQPTSIVKNETIPKLKKDSTYLEKNHMVLLDTKGNLVPTSNLDFKNLSVSRFPYLVRQEPGPWNALGEMKFMFPNKYDIYLHDTPSKSLFSRASRAFSHGCIRVDKPLELALKLLDGTEYDRKKLESIISTHETTRVNLPQPVDILLMYWTCGIDRNGKLFFAPDIYERDMDVLRELDKSMR
jgi:murein L,D-transpeptidase YcbB/YkuD